MVGELTQRNREVYLLVQGRNDDADEHDSPEPALNLTKVSTKIHHKPRNARLALIALDLRIGSFPQRVNAAPAH